MFAALIVDKAFSQRSELAKRTKVLKSTPIRWQHVVPQDWDGNQHTIKAVGIREPKPLCAVCSKRIKRVDENEGPEGLKAMFRF